MNGCYAAFVNDCDGVLTDEHFVSHGMLKILAGSGKRLKVTGIKPGDSESVGLVSPRRFMAPVLCERHNNALNPIDTTANRFYEAANSIGTWLEHEAPGTERIVAFNGHDLERWCLKALCGFLARASKPVPELWVRTLFGYGSNVILPPRGLYVYAQVGDIQSGDNIGLEEVLHRDEGPVGLIVRMLRHELVFSMTTDEPVSPNEHIGKWRVQRPESFTYRNPANKSECIHWLSWQDSLHHVGIHANWSPNPPGQP